MTTRRVLLTSKEFEQLANELVEELQRLPLYDVDGKRHLCTRYLREIESIILDNINKLDDHRADSVIAHATFDMLKDE